MAAGWVVLLFAAYWALGRLRTLLIMILVAFFLSLAMEPAVDRLARRGWRRGSATGLVLGGVLVFTAIFFAAAGSIVVGQASDLVDNAPRYVRDFERFVNDDLGIEFDADSLVRELRNGDGLSANNSDIVSGAVGVALAVGRGLLYFVTVLVFAFYMTADGPRMRRAICSRLPRARQEVVLDTWEIAIEKTGGYLYSRGIQAAISAFVTWAFLLALDVPYSLALGLWVGIVSQFIPTVGTYIAMVLPVLVAFKQDSADALYVLAFLVLYQQFENYILGPEGHQALDERASRARDRNRVRRRPVARRRRRDPRASRDGGDPGDHLRVHHRTRRHRRTPRAGARAHLTPRAPPKTVPAPSATPTPKPQPTPKPRPTRRRSETRATRGRARGRSGPRRPARGRRPQPGSPRCPAPGAHLRRCC